MEMVWREEFFLHLGALAALPRLHTLVLSASEINDETHEVDVSDNHFCACEGFNQGVLLGAAQLTHLRQLCISFAGLWSDENVRAFLHLLGSLPNLQELDGMFLAHVAAKLLVEAHGVAAPQLLRLRMEGSETDVDDLRALIAWLPRAFPRLHHLSFSDLNSRHQAETLLPVFAALRHCESLTSLDLDVSCHFHDPDAPGSYYRAEVDLEALQRTLGDRVYVLGGGRDEEEVTADIRAAQFELDGEGEKLLMLPQPYG